MTVEKKKRRRKSKENERKKKGEKESLLGYKTRLPLGCSELGSEHMEMMMRNEGSTDRVNHEVSTREGDR